MVRFRETQTFRSSWVFWLVLLVIALGAFGAWRAAGAPPPTLAGWTPIAITGFFLVWLAAMRLETEVREDHLRVRFHWLWVDRRIDYADIAEATAKKYRPILDYGGWGVRGFPTVRALNVRGAHGVLLDLRDGRRLMIGSQRADELEAAIRERIAAGDRAA